VRTQIPGKQILDSTVDTADIEDGAVTDDKLAATGVAAGTFTKVTVNSTGRVTAAENPTTLAGYGIVDAISATDAASFPVVLTSPIPGFVAGRALAGTTDQIDLTNNDVDTLTISLADDAVLPGTGALTLTTGTTAQRPTGAAGMIRHNSTLDVVEVWGSADWQQLVVDSDKRFGTPYILTVSTDPAPGQFSSIKTAMDSITGASITTPYVIQVMPGEYVEDTIDFKPFVRIKGWRRRSVRIIANDPDANLINAANGAGIASVTLMGSTGTDAALINHEPTENGNTFHALDLHFGSA